MKDIRWYLGKHCSPNQDTHLQQTTTLIRERKDTIKYAAKKVKKEKNSMRTKSKKSAKQKNNTLAVLPILCHQLMMIDKLNVWGDRPIFVGDYKREVQEPSYFSDPSGKHKLNTEILFDISHGMD